MSRIYLITGATSPLGLALMGRLLPALEEGDLILAQGCGDLSRLAGLCQERPGFIRPYDVDFSQPVAISAFLEDLTDSNELFADPADRASAESDRAFTLRIRDRERRLIRKIQAAIQRLDDGTYGICEDCGEEISIPRLKARPVTNLSINCKARQEEG